MIVAVAIGRGVADRVAAANLARDPLTGLEHLARRARQEAFAAGRARERFQDARVAVEILRVEDAHRVDGDIRFAGARQHTVDVASLALSPPSLTTTSTFRARDPRPRWSMPATTAS